MTEKQNGYAEVLGIPRKPWTPKNDLVNKHMPKLKEIAKKHGFTVTQTDSKGNYHRIDDPSDSNKYGEMEKLRWMKDHPQKEDGGFNNYTGQRSGESGIDVHHDEGKFVVNNDSVEPRFKNFSDDIHREYHGKSIYSKHK